MKKLSLVTVGVLALICLAGCGKNNNNLKIDSNQPLTKVGQYHEADSNDPKTTLLAIKDMKKSQTVEKVTFNFKKAKLLKMEAKNKSQLSDDELNFGISLPKTYYEYQLDYTLKNDSNRTIHDNGAEVILPNGKQLSTNESAIDSLVGEKIQAHASKDGFIQAKVSKSDKSKLNQFKFVTPELTNANGENITNQQKTIVFN